MNLRKDHYRNFLRINFRRKKSKRCIHLCLQTGRTRLFTRSVCSAVGKAASGALVPGCPLLPAAAYNPRSRGSADAVGSRGNSVFARMGRQCYNIHLSVTGYLSRKLCVSGRALIARGLTRCFSCVLLCCATVQRGRPQPFNRYSHPASPPRDTTPVFSFHNCYLSMTTFMVVARSSVARASRL